jgi:hypothetical protein
MLRSWISLAALFVLVAGLGAWIYFKPVAPTPASHALSALEPQDVKRIALERPARDAVPAVAVVLERGEDGWRMTQPVPARAETAQIDRLLALLNAQSVARYPASDLERYGLDRPLATIALNNQAFAFGAVNDTTREQYVQSGEHVYAIPLALRTSLPRDASALISRALFGPGETPVRFELPGFTASLEDGSWVLTPPGDDPGPDERNGWAGAWRQATAVQATPHDGRQPLENISVGLKDGRTLTLGILQREPELVLLRADEGIQYRFLSGTAKRLLTPPGAPAKP